MNSNALKIFVFAAIVTFIGAGVSLAGDDRGPSRGNAYGHYKHSHNHYHHYEPPRPVHVVHYYRPIVVERHYYCEPVRYVAPAPSAFFFGFSVAEPGTAFSFGIGRN
jgi:hypothetical protein